MPHASLPNHALPAVFRLITLTMALPLLPAIGAEPDAVATQILGDTGVTGGLVVHLGCGDGQLTAALGQAPSVLVHGLDTRAAVIRNARQHIRALGCYGRVSADVFDGAHLPYTDRLVRLLVADNPGRVSQPEMERVLTPGGVAYIRQGDNWKKIVKPWPASIDEWTHYLHDASNNAVARDTEVGAPRRYQWIAGPRWARSHDHLSSTSAMVSAHGRIFYIIDNGPISFAALAPRWQLVARDAFSGVWLWERDIGPWEGHLRDFRSGPADLARRLVAVANRVYVTLGYGKPVSVLDAATGQTLRELPETTNALELICAENRVLAVVGDRAPDGTVEGTKPIVGKNVWHWWPIYGETQPRKHLVALDAGSGIVQWRKDDADTAELMPTTLAAADGKVFFHSGKAIVALAASTGRELWRTPRPVSRQRPSWSAPTLVVHDGVLLCGDRALGKATADSATGGPIHWTVDSRGGIAPKGEITAFAADSGKELWRSPCREGYNSPPDVLVADQFVWSGDLVLKRDPGITVARALRTGEVQRRRPPDAKFVNLVMGHHRCYRNKATTEYLVLGRDGIELVDLDTGKATSSAWVRGACQYGVMPCNGLLYAPPHSCACHIESKLDSFNALASALATAPPAAGPRLQQGPAYGELPSLNASAEASADWPTYRHDAGRGGRASSVLSSDLEETWSTPALGSSLSSPVAADGRVFVADTDGHRVLALDARSGEAAWQFTAGGRVDSPPTLYRGRAVFGCRDGWIYCLRAADGELAWRFRAARGERRIVCYDQLESPSPVPGSVLILEPSQSGKGIVYAAAGRTPFLDGGMSLCRLDVTTGKRLSETPINGAALPDVLSCQGDSVYLRHRRFDQAGEAVNTPAPHLYSPAGFLDGSWWHRTYWLLGAGMRSGWGSWPVSGNRVPSGRLLVLDDTTVFGFGRLNQYHRNGSHVGLGAVRYLLYAADRAAPAPPPRKTRRGQAAPAGVTPRWSRPLPIFVRAMVLSGDTLFAAGPPDLLSYPDPENPPEHPYAIASIEALSRQQDALEGKHGARLLALAAADGRTRADIALAVPPAWDGMAVADGRLFLACRDGRLHCYAPRQKHTLH